jgi:hypothetical protein
MASGLCVPHKQAAHMAAPTEGQSIKNTLANGEPSTHGACRAGWLGSQPLIVSDIANARFPGREGLNF